MTIKEKIEIAYAPVRNLLQEKYGLELSVAEMDIIIKAIDETNELIAELFRRVCDVDGCNENEASGGGYWRDTGYWLLCSKHCDAGRKELPQPQMKQEAIQRERSRRPDGTLPAID
jgi:hypothetical protein